METIPEFTNVLENWQLFFSTVALASVTLAGLLFVSLSLRPEHIRRDKSSPFMRLARNSFADFLYVLMLGLIFLVPHPVPMGLAVALFVLGFSRSVGLIRYLPGRDPSMTQKRSMGRVVREIALPAVSYLGLIVVAIEVFRGDLTSIYTLVLVIAALLTTASWNAWLLLVEANLKEG